MMHSLPLSKERGEIPGSADVKEQLAGREKEAHQETPPFLTVCHYYITFTTTSSLCHHLLSSH